MNDTPCLRLPFFLFVLLAPAWGSAASSAVDAEGDAVSRPNILFAIADDASFPHMGAYGTPWVTTPAFDRVAEEGLLFTRAYTPNPKCAPSRAALLTGRNSWQLEEAANHWPYFPHKFKVYTEVLAEHGYFVGSTGKGWAPGIAETADGDRRHLAGQPFNQHRTPPPTNAISNIDYAANFESFLDTREGEEPFAFWYGGYEPHRSYAYRSGIEVGGKHLSDIGSVPEFWPDDEVIRIDMLDYAFEIEHFDRHLGRMLDLLEERGELENTLIVVTSDNGMPFPRVKGQAYKFSAHMPMAIMWPKGIEHTGRVIDDYISFIDIAPTFIEVTGMTWTETGMHPSPGKSLTDIFNSEAANQVNSERDRVLLGKERHDIGRPYDWGYPIRGIIREEMLYLHNFEPERWPAGNPETGYLNTDGSPTKTFLLENRATPAMYPFWRWSFGKRPADELYNIAEDPACLHNLANDPEFQATKQAMKTELFKALKEQEDPRMFGRGYVFDTYSYADERNRNFYYRFMQGEALSTGWVNDSDFETAPLPD